MSALNSLGTAGTAPAMNVQQIIDLRNRIIERNDALQTIHASETARAANPAQGAAQSFDDTLQSMLGGVNAAQSRAQDVSAAYQRGEVTDVAQVMLARQEAGVAFEATLQVRNKLLSAYQDIMRMGV
ncbi:flagellar hook-basal body complex protein FliE [Croceicoccus sp. Ery15]|uniref:flagellar hook-basal body complex protein FliE n=1 Tax=Croceicoccus sp. Ery15 TaxID=1703338 RepID=UPI001E36420A|nr:flagellar hook-basal body complex protein FliE [Croceicoccus sp. Ery15]